MNAPFVSRLLQISTNVKGIRARMAAFAQTWLQTIPANARGSTWEGTVSTVSVVFSRFLCIYISISLYLYPYSVDTEIDGWMIVTVTRMDDIYLPCHFAIHINHE